MFVSAVRKCRFCCIFAVWLLSDCYPAVLQSSTLGQVTGLLQWKSNQANPLRSLTILSAAALHCIPSATHTAHATHAYNELFDRYGDGHMHINHLTSCELGTDIQGLGAKRNTKSLPATTTTRCNWLYIVTSQRRSQRWIYPLGINSVKAKIHKHSPHRCKQTLYEAGLALVTEIAHPPLRKIMPAFHHGPGPTSQGPGVEPSLDLSWGHKWATQRWPVLDQIPLAKWGPFNSPRVCGCMGRGGVAAGNFGFLLKTE